MNEQWSWTPFLLGLLGGAIAEFLRWRRMLPRLRSNSGKRVGVLLGLSAGYALIGGVLAALFSGASFGALYMGFSWPVFFSGARSYVRGTASKTPAERGVCPSTGTSGENTWEFFDRGLL